jgi:hypothetical protein
MFKVDPVLQGGRETKITLATKFSATQWLHQNPFRILSVKSHIKLVFLGKPSNVEIINEYHAYNEFMQKLFLNLT